MTAIGVAIVMNWCWRPILRLEVYAFVVVLLWLQVWAMCVVLSNVEQPVVYEFAAVGWRRRERHLDDGHSRDFRFRIKVGGL